MKIFSIVGARPQFVKMAVLSREFENYSEAEHQIIHTGQHYDEGMSEVFFREMHIPKAKWNLGINGLEHGAMTGRMLEEIEKILLRENPDAIIVYGDTNSTLAGALAARKLSIPLAHVEAGLRSFNMQMPEEINRILTDRISDYLYCPSQTAINNLEQEGFQNFPCEVINSGDVMLDAALFYGKLAERQVNSIKIADEEEDFILCTLHRQENTDDSERLISLVNSINRVCELLPVIMPLHPRTQKKLDDQKLELKASIIPPVSYFSMLQLLKKCRLVMTDSGGLQKEAYFFNKYCITLREETEWTELTELGVNQLVGSNEENILLAVKHYLMQNPLNQQNVYGKGNAGEKIVNHLLSI